MGNIIAIIPARAGSKGLPGKNIKELKGKPLISYTIEAALRSEIFKTIVVSTDGTEIAKIAAESGAEVPFIRPDCISDDKATSFQVVEHCLNYYNLKGKTFDSICLLQPTSPLRNAIHIQEAYELFIHNDFDRVVSVCECEHSPIWTGTIDENQMIHMISNELLQLKPRQQLPKYYRLNGAIYFVNTNVLLSTRDFIGSNCATYIMDRRNSVDIDSMEDFLFAEYLLENNNL